MKNKRIISIFLILIILSAVFSISFVNAQDQANDGEIIITEIDGEIFAGTQNQVERALRISETREAPLIIKMDTPGGLLEPTEEIVDKILESEQKVIGWVTPDGANSYSAGSMILLSTDIAAMNRNTRTGLAEPRPADEKIITAVADQMERIAEQQGRPGKIARSFVENNLSINEENALAENVIDLIAEDFSDIENYLGIEDPEYKEVDIEFSGRFLNFVSNPQIATIFFLIGMLGVASEITSGGVGVPGVIGGIFLILAFLGLQILEVSTVGIALVFLGAILMAAEVYEPGFGVFGIGGVISLIIGLILIGPGADPWVEIPQGLMWGGAIALMAIVGLLVWVVRKSLMKDVETGMESMIGKRGKVLKDLDPDGVIRVKGERWASYSEREKIKEGEEVIVDDIVERDGKTALKVKSG